MGRYLAGRVVEGVFVVLGVVTVIFVLVRLVGDPVALLMPIGASEAQRQALRVELGLDQAIYIQYFEFLRDAVLGDFGASFTHFRPAAAIILASLPATLMLAGAALAFGIIVGGTMAIVAARFHNTPIASIVMFPALIGQAMPVFWLGIVLIQVFAVNLELLPTSGSGTLAHLVLPAVTLGMFLAASIARLLRSSLIEVMGEDFVRTAHAKGLRGNTVLFRHIVRNALGPAVTMIGILAGEVLGGAVITETVFAWPGVGRTIVDAISTNDFPVVQAGGVLLSVIFVSINILVDLSYSALDPRVRLTRS
jgi:peptide/nickel transport system permease protein